MGFKVTNKTNEVMKFRDKFLGKDILVEPKGFVFTNKPPKESEIWKIELNEQKDKKETKLMEVKNNGSNSNRRRLDGNLLDSNIKSRRK